MKTTWHGKSNNLIPHSIDKLGNGNDVHSHPQLLNSSFCTAHICTLLGSIFARINCRMICVFSYFNTLFLFSFLLKKRSWIIIAWISPPVAMCECKKREKKWCKIVCDLLCDYSLAGGVCSLKKKKLIAFFQLTQCENYFSQREIPQLGKDGITNQWIIKVTCNGE